MMKLLIIVELLVISFPAY
ncbi:type I toxin-antitoxin system Ibs family toxin [Escherichia coli]|nr:type I toxin-antitoxin system Ibs family toxin [Escherichia coli]ELH7430106.1 type I toxin-antitoxin system Ibs family toxin [Escherichia coli]